MIDRHCEAFVKNLATEYPVVAITGPRQSGKTTLAKHLFSDRDYVSLENPDARIFAEEDPRGFLAKYRSGAVIDEAQRTPGLFSYLQQIVDESMAPGRFILTGSQQFGLMSGITQSLAGRVAMVQLLPFALGERYTLHLQKPPVELDNALFTGLYPPIHDRDLQPARWYANYIETYVERDVRQMVNVRDLTAFRRFLRLCAGRVGQLVNLSGVASDCGITHNTAKAWLSILEASYIVFMLPPHHRNFNKRIIKTPKLYFYDSGLCVRLLGIQSPDQLRTHALRGAIFESFVIGELMKYRFNCGLLKDFFFWRDRAGTEVDALIEQGEKLQPVEIKSGQTLNRDFFKGLNKWTALAGPVAIRPTLVYGGEDRLESTGITVFPWFVSPGEIFG
ncbi:MAG: ATP-binding protein [Desulfobacterales bacterium]|nr:ATP-binding protein [Desulfobacterales bacterium]